MFFQSRESADREIKEEIFSFILILQFRLSGIIDHSSPGRSSVRSRFLGRWTLQSTFSAEQPREERCSLAVHHRVEEGTVRHEWEGRRLDIIA